MAYINISSRSLTIIENAPYTMTQKLTMHIIITGMSYSLLMKTENINLVTTWLTNYLIEQ